jgi:hypothetical protein
MEHWIEKYFHYFNLKVWLSVGTGGGVCEYGDEPLGPSGIANLLPG